MVCLFFDFEEPVSYPQITPISQMATMMMPPGQDLSLIGKQLHWTVVGPDFRPLHLQLDELVDSWRELSDTVAERAVALGVMPDGQAKAECAFRCSSLQRGGGRTRKVHHGGAEDTEVEFGAQPDFLLRALRVSVVMLCLRH